MALTWHQCGKWMMWHHVAYDEVALMSHSHGEIVDVVGVGVQGVGLGKGEGVRFGRGVGV
jgi:hypothetical protein